MRERSMPDPDPEDADPAATISGQIDRLSDLVSRYEESDARFSGIIDTLVDAVVTIGGDGIIESANPAAEALFGYTNEEMVGRNINLIVPLDFTEEHSARISAYLTTGESQILGRGRGREVECRHKDGPHIPAQLTISEMRVRGARKFTGIVRDITEIKEKEAELAHKVAELEDIGGRQESQGQELVELADSLAIARDEAEGANRAKSGFLAHMSHELRNPLNAILGFAEIMREQMLGPMENEQYRQYSADIHDSGTHLLALINDILDLAKVEAGGMELAEGPVGVAAVIAASMRFTKERAHKSNVTQVSEVPADLPTLYADERKLKQILINLLSNAVKFTPPGGRITVRAGLDAGRAMVLSVADTGIGMTPEEIPKALSEFGQVGKAGGGQGTGLGLPLTKGLVELHGGEFTLESEPGVGTTVTLRFPADRVHDGA